MPAQNRPLLARLSYRSLPTALLYEHYWYRRRLRDRTAVLVYQMGKVGSWSVAQAVRQAPGYWPIHIHYLSRENLQVVEAGNRRQYQRTGRMARHYLESLYTRWRLANGGFPRPLKVITLTREPVGRSLSAFFHFLECTYPEIRPGDRLREVGMDLLIEELTPYFQERFPWDLERPAAWFEAELKGVLRFDAFSEDFDRDAGYAIYRGAELEVLIIKLEHLSRCGGRALGEFLGTGGLEVRRSNEASSRADFEVYQAFQKRAPLDPEVVERCYSSRYVRHFYSEAEIAGFQARWLGTSP